MAGPLAFAVGAGALAGTAVAAFQERERRQHIYTYRSRDAQAQQLLANPTRLQQLQTPSISSVQDQPVWLLLVHVKEANVGKRLRGSPLQVRVKYGSQGWSLKRVTEPVRAKLGADGSCCVAFNQTLMFLWRRTFAPHLRIKLSKLGRLTRTLGQTEFTFKFTGTSGHHDKELQLESMDRSGTPPTLRVIAEMRAIPLGELRAHGFNVGKVVSQPRLAGPSVMPPLLQGVAIAPAAGMQPLTPAWNGIVEGCIASGATVASPVNGGSYYNITLEPQLAMEVLSGHRMVAQSDVAETLFREVPAVSEDEADDSVENDSSQSDEDRGHRSRWSMCA